MTPDRTRPTIALFVYSAREKARIPPLRLRAMLGEAVAQGGRLALVCSEDCFPERDEIVADVWRDCAFRRERCDRPDVVAIMTEPTLARHRYVRDWLRRRGPVVESIAPAKGGLHDLLRAGGVAAHLIPQIVLPTDARRDALAGWLATHGGAVIKPTRSRNGRRIMFLLPEESGWALRLGEETVAGDLDAIVARIEGEIGGRSLYRDYLLQRFIRSRTADGRALHLRIDLHKDGAGRWRRTQASAVVSEVGMLVANLSNGAYEGSLDVALAQRTARPAADIRRDALGLATAVAEALDADPASQVCDLGIDLCLDEDDHVWLVEANIGAGAKYHQIERAGVAVSYLLAVARGEIALRTPPAP